MTDVIIFNNPKNGYCSVVHTSPFFEGTTEELIAGVVPEGVMYSIVTPAVVPTDITLRNAWRKEGDNIIVDLVPAKEIAHDLRRGKRSELLKPFDDCIARQIPGQDLEHAEANRAQLRAIDATVQGDIDGALDEGALKTVITDYLGAGT